jgi:hypothetical protein
MKKLHFLFLLVGGLLILGCPLGVGGGEGQGGTVQEDLTVTASPSYGGTITRSPDQTQYASESSVTLTANPASGYVFTRWDGDATGSENPTTITMNRAKTATAVFTWSGLTVTASPSYGGTVTRSPDLTQYEPGTVVTLTANPAPGYVFVRWEGGATGSENPTTIVMNGGKFVRVVFSSNSLKLTVQIPTGGSVALSPNLTQYEYGTVVTLTANPAPDYQFTRWEGDATGSENPTTITMNSDKKVQAVFTPTKPFIQLSSDWISVSVCKSRGVPSPITIEITNGGAGTLSGLEHNNHGSAGSYLFFSTLSSSTAPATLTVTFTDSLLTKMESYPEGAQMESQIQVTSAVAMNSPQTIHVAVTHIPEPAPYTPPGPINPPSYKVICAELHRQGLMDETIFKADEAFGRYLRDNQRDVLLGYQLWAKPVVRWMQKSKTVTRIVASVATPWSYEMAYRMGARDKGSFAGKILMDVGVPVCRTIGRAMILAGNTGPRDDADSSAKPCPVKFSTPTK